MKPIIKTLLFAVITVGFWSCDKNAANPESLNGKWKKFDSFYSTGGPLVYVPAGNKNDYVSFKDDSTFKSNVFNSFVKYSVKDSSIIEFRTADNITKKYFYQINKDTLTLSQAEPRCIEGCGDRFIKE